MFTLKTPSTRVDDPDLGCMGHSKEYVTWRNKPMFTVMTFSMFAVEDTLGQLSVIPEAMKKDDQCGKSCYIPMREADVVFGRFQHLANMNTSQI